MAALTADINLRQKDQGQIQSYPVADNVKIYKGAMVNFAAGLLTNSAGADTSQIAGIAYEQVDNTLAGHVAGGKRCRVEAGRRVLMTGSGFSQASVGVFATVVDNQTIGTGGTSKVGKIVEYISATQVWVFVPFGVTAA